MLRWLTEALFGTEDPGPDLKRGDRVRKIDDELVGTISSWVARDGVEQGSCREMPRPAEVRGELAEGGVDHSGSIRSGRTAAGNAIGPDSGAGAMVSSRGARSQRPTRSWRPPGRSPDA